MPKAGFRKRCDLFCSGCSKTFKRESDLSHHSCNVELEGLEVTVKTEKEASPEGYLDVEMVEEYIFPCEVCHRTFKTSRGCKKHMSFHFNENREKRSKGSGYKDHSQSLLKKKHVCTCCPQIFTTKKELKNHFKIHISHSPNVENSNPTNETKSPETKSVSYCSSGMKSSLSGIKTSESKSISHTAQQILSSAGPYAKNTTLFEKKILKKEYVCGYCNLKFTKLKDYRAHYKSHDVDSQTQIVGCGLFGAEYIVDYPKAKLHECPNCSQTFQKIGSFRRHLRSHLNIRAYSCKHCLLNFLTKSQLISHVKQKCKSKEKKYSCGLCKKKFYHRMSFMQHKTEHIGDPPYKCPTCGASFPSVSRRNRHLAHHFVKCPICRKAYASDVKLWQHLNCDHSDIENCDVPCDTSEEEGDTDQAPSDFNEMDVESGNDSYTSIDSDSDINEKTVKSKVSTQNPFKKASTDVCFICEQRFPNEVSLHSHMQSHQIYYCAFCPKFFPQESKLKAHQLEHDQDKIFDDLVQSVQVQTTASIPIQNAAADDSSDTSSSVFKGEETEKACNIIEWYNGFNQLLGNLQYPIGHDLCSEINNYISEMASILSNDNISQETRDTYKKIHLKLTDIIKKNGESLLKNLRKFTLD